MNRKLCTVLTTFLSVASIPAQERLQQLERHVVSFQDRSFDLSAFRASVLGHEPEGLKRTARIVDELEAEVRRDQADFVGFIERKGGRVTHQWWLVNACAVEIGAEHLDALRRHKRVFLVEKDRLLRPGWIKTATNGKNHHVDALHAKGIKGKGVGIAIVDSGLDSNMNAQKRPHRTFYLKGDPKNTSGGGLNGSRLLANIKIGLQPADDILGHGTMVAGIAAGEIWGSKNGDAGHAPEAGVVGYSIADTSAGLAKLTTMVSALQRMAADKKKYNIAVGNLSYQGSAVPSWVEQRALDSAVLNADILMAVMGGNGGSSTHFSHAATNVIAVGAAHADVHKVATFSSRGPIQPGRTFPDIIANGVDIAGPLADSEHLDRVRSGTSNASPQVAGAAALYRSVKPAASALETRAALLATAQNVSYDNSQIPYNSANAYGQGYLRDDQLVKVAQGAGMVQNASLSTATKTRTYRFTVQAGKFYAVAIAWYRYNLMLNTGWSDLALSVDQGTKNLGKSDSLRNTYEKVEFRPATSGSVTITVKLNTLEAGQAAIPFALVANESLPFQKRVLPVVRAFGSACPGSLVILGVRLPPAIAISGPPTIGTSHSISVSPVLPSTPVVIVFGVSNSKWGGSNLPIDLTPFGGKGCSIYSSIELMVPTIASGGGLYGVAAHRIMLPNLPVLAGATYFAQGAAHDPAGNALRMTTTGGLSITIGN